MVTVKASASRCVLIGDFVASRRAPDRRALHRTVESALTRVGAVVPAVTELRIVVGDEFQGAFATLGAAIDAALLVRLELLPDADVRVGIGRGPVELLDAERGIEDGPGWWAARAAVEAVEDVAARAATRHARTAYRSSPEPPAADPAEPAVNAALLCRDHLVGSLSDRSLRLLRGLMDPHTTQGRLAEREGISASAVSQRVRSDGIGAVLAAHDLLRSMP